MKITEDTRMKTAALNEVLTVRSAVTVTLVNLVPFTVVSTLATVVMLVIVVTLSNKVTVINFRSIVYMMSVLTIVGAVKVATV